MDVTLTLLRKIHVGYWLARMFCALCAGAAVMAQPVDWPRYGPLGGGLVLDGHTNTVPDIVGPVDGSARLTIFTEGNHYPVFLPLALDGFPRWCADTGACDLSPADILVVTLPQVMIVQALEGGRLRLGNAVIPLAPDTPVFPDLVVGGAGPLRRLAGQGLVAGKARIFARHKGLGLLVRRDMVRDDLGGFAAGVQRLAIATPQEAGARRQYEHTLQDLIGAPEAVRLLRRDIGAFPGRLGIQHRDIPYALLNGLADGGVIFGHLAAFYASAYPDRLRAVTVPGAAPFGQTIAVAPAMRTVPSPVREVFLEYLLAVASSAYPKAGFHGPEAFAYGEALPLAE